MGLLRSEQSRRGGRRIEQQVDKSPLVFGQKADQMRLFDRLLRGFLGGGDDEVAYASAFDLGGALDYGERIGGDAGLDTSGSVRFTRRHTASLSRLIVRRFPVQGQGL